MMKTITFISGNTHKVAQLKTHIDYPFLHKHINLKEIQSVTLEEVVEHKTLEAYSHIKSPVLIEDTSLIFHALHQLPGPLIKWFLSELGTDGLCKLLDGYTDRSATARVLFGYYDGKKLVTFDGSIKGMIAQKARGEVGFGWDPIFIPEGKRKTWGEMNAEEQMKTSMRKIALNKLHTFLTNQEKITK